MSRSEAGGEAAQDEGELSETAANTLKDAKEMLPPSLVVLLNPKYIKDTPVSSCTVPLLQPRLLDCDQLDLRWALQKGTKKVTVVDRAEFLLRLHLFMNVSQCSLASLAPLCWMSPCLPS